MKVIERLFVNARITLGGIVFGKEWLWDQGIGLDLESTRLTLQGLRGGRLQPDGSRTAITRMRRNRTLQVVREAQPPPTA